MNGLDELVLRLSLTIAHLLWVGTLLWLMAYVADRVLVGTAAGRHGVHLLGLLAMVVAFPVCFLVSSAPEAPPYKSVATAREEAPAIKNDASAIVRTTSKVSPVLAPGTSVEFSSFGGGQGKESVRQRLGSDTASEPWGEWWPGLCSWVSAVYAFGLLMMALRLALGWVGSARLRKRSETISGGPWSESLEKMARWLALRGEVAIAWSRDVVTPVVVGFVKPVILIPVALTNRLTPAQAEAVIAHELAHLHRRDHWTVVVQRLAETLLFFHPGVWWMSQRMDAVREEACDDMVVAAGCDPADYAEALVICSACRSEHWDLTAQFAQPLAAVGKRGDSLRQRVMKLLGQMDEGPVRLGRVGWLLAGLALGGVVMISLIGGSLRSDLADFDFDNPPSAYEKRVEVANRDQEFQVDGLHFKAAPLKWMHVSAKDPDASEEGSQWELNLDIGEESGYEIVEIRLFDHRTRELIHNGNWREPRVENPKFLAERIGDSSSVRIRELGGSLPEKIDIWLRVVSQGAGPIFSIPAAEGAAASRDGSDLVITKLFAGTANGRGDGPTGEMVWDMATVHAQDRSVTVNLQNRSQVIGGRYHVVAVTKDGVRYPMDHKHFIDFSNNKGHSSYVQLDVPPDELDHFEVIPFKDRHKFFFNGLEVPGVGSALEVSRTMTEQLQRWFEKYEAGQLSEKDLLSFVLQRGPETVGGLIEYLDRGPTDGLAMKAIEQFEGHPQAVAHLVQALEKLSRQPGHIKPNRRHCCISLLGKMGNESHVPLIARFMEQNWMATVGALGAIGGEEATRELMKAFDLLPGDKWWVIAQNLERAGDPGAVPELKRRLAMVEAPPTERFTNNTVPAFINAIRKLSGEGDGDMASTVWRQGQHFKYPFDGPGSPKSFSVDPLRDHFVKLPKVDPSTDTGRDAIWTAFAEQTEGPGFTIDEDEVVLFNGLRAMPLWEDGPPYPTTMWDWIGRVSHRKLVEQAKREARKDRVPIPVGGYLLALDPDGCLYTLSLKRTTNDPQYSVGVRAMDPLRQLVQPSPNAHGPYTDWRGCPLHDVRSKQENGALNLNRGHMVHLTEAFLGESGPDVYLAADFAGGQVGLLVPGAEEFVLVDAVRDMPADELVQRLAMARIEEPHIKGHEKDVNIRDNFIRHVFEDLQPGQCFGFAVRMPGNFPVAGLLEVREVDRDAQILKFNHCDLFTDLARQAFAAPTVRLERKVFRGPGTKENPFIAEWEARVPDAMADRTLSLQILTLEGGKIRSQTSWNTATTLGEQPDLRMEIVHENGDDGREGLRWTILGNGFGNANNGREKATAWVPVDAKALHQPLGRNRVSGHYTPLLWVRGKQMDLLVAGILTQGVADAGMIPSDAVPEMLAGFERGVRTAASLPRDVLVDRALSQIHPDFVRSIRGRTGDLDLQLAMMYDSEVNSGIALEGGQSVAEKYYLAYLPRAKTSAERCRIFSQLSVLYSTNVHDDFWEKPDYEKSRLYAARALREEPDRIGHDTIRARLRLYGPDQPEDEQFEGRLRSYAWLTSFNEETLRDKWLPEPYQIGNTDRHFPSMLRFWRSVCETEKNNLFGMADAGSGRGFIPERLRRIVDVVPNTEAGRMAWERLEASTGALAEKAGKPVAKLIIEATSAEELPPAEITCRLDGDRIALDQLPGRLRTMVDADPDLNLFIFIHPELAWANMDKVRALATKSGVKHVVVSTTEMGLQSGEEALEGSESEKPTRGDSEVVWDKLRQLPPVESMFQRMIELGEEFEDGHRVIFSSHKKAGLDFRTVGAWATTMWPVDAARFDAFVVMIWFPEYEDRYLGAIWQVFLVDPETGAISLIRDRTTGETIALDDWLKLENPTSVYSFEEARAASFEVYSDKNRNKAFEVYQEASRLYADAENDDRAIELFQKVGIQAQAGTDFEFCRRAADLAEHLESMRTETAPDENSESMAGKLERLIWELRNLRGHAMEVPGKVGILPSAMSANPEVREFASAIMARVQAPESREQSIRRLISMLDDPRPTRLWAGALNGGHFLRNGDVALEILSKVAGTTFDGRSNRDAYLWTASPELRQEIIERVKDWWASTGGNTEGTRNERVGPWGDAIQGVQARLRPDKFSWIEGDVPTFRADIRNQGGGEYNVAQSQQLCELEVDGARYIYIGSVRVRSSWLPPGRVYEDIPIELNGQYWFAASTSAQDSKSTATTSGALIPLKLSPGKHSLRVIFFCDGGSSHRNIVIESNLVEFEIAAAKNDEEFLKAAAMTLSEVTGLQWELKEKPRERGLTLYGESKPQTGEVTTRYAIFPMAWTDEAKGRWESALASTLYQAVATGPRCTLMVSGVEEESVTDAISTALQLKRLLVEQEAYPSVSSGSIGKFPDLVGVKVAPFTKLTVEVSQTIWAGKAKLVIRGDGSGTFGTGTWAPPWGTAGPPGEWREVEFHLTSEQLKSLTEGLERSEWLAAKFEAHIAPADMPDYTFHLEKDGKVRGASVWGQGAYAPLVAAFQSLVEGLRKRGPQGSGPPPAATEWGHAVDGVQLRARPEKHQWQESEVVRLLADIRNGSRKEISIWRDGIEGWEIEVDGTWYASPIQTTSFSVMLPAGGTMEAIAISLGKLAGQDRWRAVAPDMSGLTDGPALKLPPGKHTIRVAVTPGVVEKDSEGRPVHRIPGKDASGSLISPPVEIEILAAGSPSGSSTAVEAKAEALPGFAVYLVENRPEGVSFESVPLADFTLAEVPLIGQDDIFSYDWESHTIRLKNQAVADRILKRKGGGYADAFLVVANGERIYAGVMMSALSSTVPKAPVIHVGSTAGQFQPQMAVRIHPPPINGTPDLRYDERIERSLVSLKLLAGFKTDPDAVGEQQYLATPDSPQNTFGLVIRAKDGSPLARGSITLPREVGADRFSGKCSIKVSQVPEKPVTPLYYALRCLAQNNGDYSGLMRDDVFSLALGPAHEDDTIYLDGRWEKGAFSGKCIHQTYGGNVEVGTFEVMVLGGNGPDEAGGVAPSQQEQKGRPQGASNLPKKPSPMKEWSDWTQPVNGMRFRIRALAEGPGKDEEVPVQFEIQNVGKEARYIVHPAKMDDAYASVVWQPHAIRDGRPYQMQDTIPLAPMASSDWFVLLNPGQSITGIRRISMCLPKGNHSMVLRVPEGWLDQGLEAGMWDKAEIDRIAPKAWRGGKNSIWVGPIRVEENRDKHTGNYQWRSVAGVGESQGSGASKETGQGDKPAPSGLSPQSFETTPADMAFLGTTPSFREICREVLRERLKAEVAKALEKSDERERLTHPGDVDLVLAATMTGEPVGKRRLATTRLAEWIGLEKVLKRLDILARDKDGLVKLHAIQVLALSGRPENVDFLRDLASGKKELSSSEIERDSAGWTLLALGDKLPTAANDRSPFVCRTLTEIHGLQQSGAQDIQDELLKLAGQVLATARQAPSNTAVLSMRASVPVAALKAAVTELGGRYPQLSGASKIPVTDEGWEFVHDCRDLGKRGYENTGPFPVAIGLNVMTEDEFQQTAYTTEMSEPSHRWHGLGLVGWITLYTGPELPPDLVRSLHKILNDTLKKIDELDQQAPDAGLPNHIPPALERSLKLEDGSSLLDPSDIVFLTPDLPGGRVADPARSAFSYFHREFFVTTAPVMAKRC
jgi:beta-lactamase regulating signal transducer with metallopeptidase domain